MNTHTFIARHFNTKNENIIYSNAYNEAGPYIDVMGDCIKTYNIKIVEIEVSNTPRTIMTSMILCSILKEKFPDINIKRPEISEKLTRDPRRENFDKITNHFRQVNKKVKNKDKHKLVLYVTHSSCYKSIFLGMLNAISSDEETNIRFIEGNRIKSNSISYITNYTKKGMFYNRSLKK